MFRSLAEEYLVYLRAAIAADRFAAHDAIQRGLSSESSAIQQHYLRTRAIEREVNRIADLLVTVKSYEVPKPFLVSKSTVSEEGVR